MKRQIFALATNGSGAATSGFGTSTEQMSILGELEAIKYVPGNIDTGATVTVTCENGGDSKPLLVKASAGTSTAWFYPRDLVHKAEDGAALTGTAGADRTEPILDGKIKVTIASGGDTKSGSLTVYYE